MNVATHSIKPTLSAALAALGIEIPSAFKSVLNSKDPFQDPVQLLSFIVYLNENSRDSSEINTVVRELLGTDYENTFDRIAALHAAHECDEKMMRGVANNVHEYLDAARFGTSGPMTPEQAFDLLESHLFMMAWTRITQYQDAPIEAALQLLQDVHVGKVSHASVGETTAAVKQLLGSYLNRVWVGDEEFDCDAPKPSLTCEQILSALHQRHTTHSVFSSGTTYTLTEIQSLFAELTKTADLTNCQNAFTNLNEDIEQFGAKGAYLLGLRRSLPFLVDRFESCGLQIGIPDFALVPSDAYCAWQSGQEIDGVLRAAFDQLNGRALIVRSSAVYSEDRDTSTGAGVYDSICVEDSNDFYSFKEAVVQVYRSVNSTRAMTYRDALGIPAERMGLVIQEYLPPAGSHLASSGYLNTARPFRPDLMDVVSSSGARSVLLREEVQTLIHNGVSGLNSDEHPRYFAHAYDSRQVSAQETINLSLVGILYDRILKKAVQLEFAVKGEKLWLLQVRPLPHSFSEKSAIEFPAEISHIYSSAALGVGDFSLPILSATEDNSRKTGIVIFERSFMSTETHATEAIPLENRFPKAGAVVVLHPSYKHHGHLETLALQRNLVLLYKDEWADLSVDISRKQISAALGEAPRGRTWPFENRTALRIVSNGREARVYDVDKH